MNINLTVQDNKKAVRKASQEVAKSKKDLLTMPEAWEKISKMKNSKADVGRLKLVKELMDAGELGRDPSKAGRNFSKSEAMKIYQANVKKIQMYGLREYYVKDLELYPLINTRELMDELLAGFRKSSNKIIALDTETEGYAGGIDVYRERLAGWSVTYYNADGKEVNGYVPILHKAVDPETGETLDELDPENCKESIAIGGLKAFAALAEETIWHNASFDLHICRNTHGIEFRGIVHDTIVMMKMLDENLMSYKLKDLATTYLKNPSETFETMFGKDAKFCEVPVWVARWYAAKDTKLTYDLYNFIMAHFNKPQFAKIKKLYERIECPVIKATFEMEAVGFEIDFEETNKQLIEGKDEIARLEESLIKAFGDIKFTSWQQLQKALYYDRDLSKYAIGKTIHVGTEKHIEGLGIYNDTFGWLMKPSGEIQLGKMVDGEFVKGKEKLPTDSKTLKKLANVDEDVKMLLDYREITKHIGSFVEKITQLMSPDGRLHASFNQLGTVTGRYSSNNPK